MQVKPVHSHKQDWHQLLLSELIGSPIVETRLGPAYTMVGHLLKFNLTKSFPVTTAKKLFFDQVRRELYCFLKGQTSWPDLRAAGVNIWDGDLARSGLSDIGPIYGHQWRNWGSWYQGGDKEGMDQLRIAIDELVKNPSTRRAIVSAWNAPEVLSDVAVLPPCHVLFQFNIVGDVLYTDVFARSSDAFLGLPFDVATFGIISRLVVNEYLQRTGIALEERLNYHIANLHLYKEHTQATLDELANEPSDEEPFLATRSQTVDNFHYDQCRLIGYDENRIIRAKLLTDESK